MSLVFANKSGTLQCMGGSVNLRSIIQQYLTPGNEGVWSLNDLQENIDLISSDASIIIDKTGGTGYDASGNAIDASGNKVLNLRVSAYGDIQNSIAGLEEQFNSNEVDGVGTRADSPTNNTSLWALAKNTEAFLPRFEYTSVAPSPPTALTAVYANFGGSIITTNIADCPILGWGNINITGGVAGATVSVRLGIGALFGTPLTVTIPISQSVCVNPIFQALAPLAPGNVNVRVQALVSAGSATVISAQTMCVANPIQA